MSFFWNKKYKTGLTGRFYFKQTFWGLTLMVEYSYIVCDFAGDESPDGTAWRKARQEDLTTIIITSNVTKRN